MDYRNSKLQSSTMQTSSVILIILPIVLLVTVCHGNAQTATCLESDRNALMDFKTGLDDPLYLLSSWQGESCYGWRGITYDNQTGAVTEINLNNPYPSNSLALKGEIRHSLAKLKSLRRLDLSFNAFNGKPIPEFLGSLEDLQYLNLSNAGFCGAIPPNLGNLSRLQYLDISSGLNSPLSADNLDWLRGLKSLKYLDMGGSDLSKVTSDWIVPLNNLTYLTELHLSACRLRNFNSSLTLVNLPSLAVLYLSGNELKSEIPNWITNISSLVSIVLYANYLFGEIPPGFSELPNLRILDLGRNADLTANCSLLFAGSWKKIEFLKLDNINLHGELPASTGDMTSLRFLHLAGSRVEGGIPSSIGKLCNLIHFDLTGNNLTKSLPEFLEGAEDCGFRGPLPSLINFILRDNKLVGKLPDWLGKLSNLLVLDLDNNLLQGPIPASLGLSVHLSELKLSGNRLNGTLPKSLGRLSELRFLDISSNNLKGIMFEEHFSNLSNLFSLNLSGNSLILEVSSNWVPPFQIDILRMGSCHLGPQFPYWLKSQSSISDLDFSNASLSGPIPNWFWNITESISSLNFSFNQLEGQLPNQLYVPHSVSIDLSFNLFRGPIPLPSIQIRLLALSNNEFSGSIPKTIGESLQKLSILLLSVNKLSGCIPDSIGQMSSIQVIDLSKNKLSGNIRSSKWTCFALKALDLRDNKLSGVLPRSLGSLTYLKSLHLCNNNFSGEIPSSFKNLSSLETLDLGNNSLTGKIPAWFGDCFPMLRILRLRLNRFSGELPSTLSNLSYLQFLDLAGNDFNGGIPVTFGELEAMTQVRSRNHQLSYGKYNGHTYYEESLTVCMKNQELKFNKTLYLLSRIDLSGNNLSGELPEAITKLEGLVVLNLSGNHISGQIPVNISRLHQLSSLDLSNNRFSGQIPSSMSSLDFLGYLNLSDNNFFGKIPYIAHMTTFEESSFIGNPGLYGSPLTVKCPADDPNKKKIIDPDSGNISIEKWLDYASIVVGFAAGIFVPYTVILIRKTWWDAYMSYVDKTADKLSYLGSKTAGRFGSSFNHHQ